MQSEVLHSLNPQLQPTTQQPPPSAEYDFSSCQRMKKLTTHDIYRFQHEQTPMIVKLFPFQTHKNYQHQVSILNRINHPNIIKIMYHRPALNINSHQQIDKSHLIVMEEATRGDLNDYLPKFGRMNQKMARTYFVQIVEALNYAYKMKPSIIHPNLLASSIILRKEGNLQICGWSQINQKSEIVKVQESVFACGEILMCFITSFMPFYKKYSQTDTFFKFINPEHIHTFWNQFHKKMNKMDKNFQFSQQFKNLIEAIFLKKIITFDQILQNSWVKNSEQYSMNQLKQLLDQNESIKLAKNQAKRKQQRQVEQKRKSLLHNHQINFGINRSQEQNQQFIKDFEQNMIRIDELPPADSFSCLKIDSPSPSFLIASIKEFLRQQNGKSSLILYEQFVLNHHKVVKINNYAVIELDFELSMLEQDEQPLQPELITLKLKLSFMKDHKKELYADISVLQSNFNAYYTNLALKFLQEKIQIKKGSQEIKAENQ